MKKLFLLSVLVSVILFSCETNKSDVKIENLAKVEVYCFYGKHRCPTCIAMEDITKKAIEDNFQKEVDAKELVFVSVDMTDDKNQALVEKFEVTSSSLIIRATIDGEEKIENLTETGFMNALESPEVLEEKVISTLKSFLK